MDNNTNGYRMLHFFGSFMQVNSICQLPQQLNVIIHVTYSKIEFYINRTPIAPAPCKSKAAVDKHLNKGRDMSPLQMVTKTYVTATRQTYVGSINLSPLHLAIMAYRQQKFHLAAVLQGSRGYACCHLNWQYRSLPLFQVVVDYYFYSFLNSKFSNIVLLEKKFLVWGSCSSYCQAEQLQRDGPCLDGVKNFS